MCKKSLKIAKGQSESINGRRTDNTMVKRKRTDNTMVKRTNKEIQNLHIKLRME